MNSQENGQVPVKIVGVDASLTSTGIAAMIYGKLDNVISTRSVNSNKKGTDRLVEIREEVYKSVFGADLVTIEGYAFAMANQAHQIGELGGVLRVMFYEKNLKVLEVAPTQLKKFATGKANASKEEIAVAAYKKWGIECRTNDETDASVLVYIGLAYMGHTDNLTAYQQEVIDALHGKSEVKKKRKKKGEA